MNTVVFDISGPYGLFKKPYSPSSPVSFPFPPPSAVAGILGAILGLDKQNYADELGFDSLKVAIVPLNPLQTYKAGINVLQTKDGTDQRYFRPRGSACHAPTHFEFLRDPAFRIFVAALPEKLHGELVTLLKDGRTVYTPTLGLANCLACVSFVGEFSAVPVKEQSWTASGVVALHRGMTPVFAPGGKYIRLRVPAAMDSNRVVHRYQEVVLTSDASPIKGEGAPENLFGVNNETVSFL